MWFFMLFVITGLAVAVSYLREISKQNEKIINLLAKWPDRDEKYND